MSEIKRGNFSEHDLTPTETESREGKILEEFEWQGEKGVLRYAKPEDIDGLVKVDMDRAEYRFEKYKIPKRENVGKGVTENLEKSLADPEKLAFIILQMGDEIVGYSEFGPSENKEEEGVVRIFTTSVLQLDKKYKRKNEKGEERGYGFGEKLRRAVLKEAKNIFHAKKIESNVHGWNKPSIALWEKLGSKRVAEFDHKDKDGKQIMVWDDVNNQWIKSTMIRFRHNIDIK